MKVRRVATGHTADGKAIVASDTEVGPITVGMAPGLEFYRLWGADEPPTFPDEGAQPSAHTYFPRVGGFRFAMFTVPPLSDVDLAPADLESGMRELEEKLPGLAAHLEPQDPAMHRTDTVDFEYVISGEVWLELDDGQQVHLKAGDTVVQNGTRHAWRNRGTEPCRMVVCLVGAHRR